VRKPRTGEHGCATTEDALAVMRSMAGRWSDEHIAASLNRMGLPTGQGKTWTAHRAVAICVFSSRIFKSSRMRSNPSVISSIFRMASRVAPWGITVPTHDRPDPLARKTADRGYVVPAMFH
jgi:hypothetical protein